MEFKSQICTTREQSKRLIELGLKVETADCFHWKSFEGGEFIGDITNEPLDPDDIPAWSLDRLIELCEDYENKIYLYENRFEAVINYIEQLITHQVFNTEYLNKI